MTNEEYWARRMTELEEQWNRKSRQELEAELAAYYRQALAHIQKDIDALYARFADDNGLTYVEASQLLQGSEYRVWRMDIEDYLKQYKDTGDKAILQELNILAMRSRITRLDKLYTETLVHLADLTKKAEDAIDKYFPTVYQDFYYHSLYDIGQKIGLRAAVTAVDDKQVLSILKTPWSGKNYSQRIWKDNAQLGKTIKDVVTQATHRGTDIETLSRLVSRRMDVGVSNARRLVRTELNFTENRAAFDSIKEAGMKYYRFSATLDRRTSATCRNHDGHVYSIDEYQPGSTAPPLHPNCRSTIAGSLYGPGKKKTGTRIARNDKGKTYYVPADMTYQKWHESKFKVADTAFMGKFTAEYGKTSVLKLNQVAINLKAVSNSQFELYAEHNASSKNRAVIFAENQLRKAKGYLPDDFIMPKVAVLAFAQIWPDVKAIGAYSEDLNVVFINSEYDTEAKVLEFLEDGKKNGVGYANNTSLAPYLHELGHSYFVQRIAALVEKENKGYTKIKDEIDNKILDIIGKEIKHDESYLLDNVSEYADKGYGTHNYGEIIAECFSVRLSGKAIVKRLLSLLNGE